MPCIQIKTNVKVNEETAEAIKSQLGKDIALLPEKNGRLADGYVRG